MLAKAVGVFLVLLNSVAVLAQTKVAGIVSDSANVVLPNVSVSVIKPGGAWILFSTTNQQGYFTFDLNPPYEGLSLKVTALGFKPFVLALNSGKNDQLEVVMQRQTIILKEVTINAGNGIVKSADTLKYDVRRFKESQDRVIADVIAKMPGLQVDEKGVISFNGKRISKVYVDGENLLDKSYKLATENIPASAVKQLQVIEHDQQVKALSGYVASDDVALNLTLTDSAKVVIANSGQVGLGNKTYVGELTNMWFKKGIKSINTFKANNIGLDLNGDLEEVGQSGLSDPANKVPSPYLTMQSEILPDLQQKYYLMNNDLSGSVNSLIGLTNDWKLRLNLNSVQLKRRYRFTNQVAYFLGADTVNYSETQDNIYRLRSWTGKVQFEKNSRSVYFLSQSGFELPYWKRNGESSLNETAFTQYQPMDHRSVSNQTKVVKAFGKNSVLEYNGLVQYLKVDEQLGISPGIHQDLLNGGFAYQEVLQNTGTRDVFIDQHLSVKKRSGNFVFSSGLDWVYERSVLISSLGLTDSLGQFNVLNHKYGNDVSFRNTELRTRFSIQYRLKKGLLQLGLNPGINFITYHDVIKKVSPRQRYFTFNPNISFRNNLGRSGEVQLNFNQEKWFGSVKDVYTGTMLVNIRQFNANSVPLPVTDTRSLSLRYSFKMPINMLFYNIEASWTNSTQNYISAFTIDSGLSRVVAVDFNNVQQQYNLAANLSKYLFFIKTNLSLRGNVGLQKGYTLYNAAITPFNGTQWNAGISLRKKIASKITFALMYDFSRLINLQKTSETDGVKNLVSSNRYRAEWNHKIGRKFSYQLNYNRVDFNQSFVQPSGDDFFDVYLKYSPLKMRGMFELQCINLLGNNLYTQSSYDSNQFNQYSLPLRDRTFLLKYQFSF